MDEVVFEEFKGTGNMELVLDKRLSERRIFPAIDINKSGTRREEKLLSQKELEAIYVIRRLASKITNQDLTESLINLIVSTKDNNELIEKIPMLEKKYG